MKPGMIMLWYGSVANVPTGWAFCDGSQGTPDLRGLFIMCAHVDAHPFLAHGTTGGSVNHDHEFTGDGHAHDLTGGNEIVEDSPNGDHSHGTNTNPATGTTDLASTYPSYHALVYIMKMTVP